MSFLKKLLGGSPAEKAPDASSAPVVPRAARVKPQPLDSVVFLPESASQRCGIVNISTSGVGLFRSAFGEAPRLGETLRGSFDFSGKDFPAVLRVIRASEDVIGFSFEGDSEALKKQVREYFEIQISAMELVKVSADALKKDPDGDAHWYRGRNNCDLYFVTKAGAIARFTLSFFGHYLEGAPGKNLKFGRVEEEEGIGQGIKGSELVRWQSVASAELLEGAAKFIEHIGPLSSNERAALLDLLRV